MFPPGSWPEHIIPQDEYLFVPDHPQGEFRNRLICRFPTERCCEEGEYKDGNSYDPDYPKDKGMSFKDFQQRISLHPKYFHSSKLYLPLVESGLYTPRSCVVVSKAI